MTLEELDDLEGLLYKKSELTDSGLPAILSISEDEMYEELTTLEGYVEFRRE